MSNRSIVRYYLKSIGFTEKSPYEWIRDRMSVTIQTNAIGGGYMIRVYGHGKRIETFNFNRRTHGYEKDTAGVDNFIRYMDRLK